MFWMKDKSGGHPEEVNLETASKRIGQRIRRIRTAKGLSQADLGAAVGLSPDRIQKYENGARKPKQDLLKRIAAALGVSVCALNDPNVTSYEGAMHAFFEMEELLDLYVEEGSDSKTPTVCIAVDFRNNFYTCLKEWLETYRHYKALLDEAATDEERQEISLAYRNWEWNWPGKDNDRRRDEIEKARLLRMIEELQDAYDNLP